MARAFSMFHKGDFVTINQDVGIVVMTGDELPGDMGDHTGVWFGRCEERVPEVRTIPTEYLEPGPTPALKH
jgi:hypothetical protein